MADKVIAVVFVVFFGAFLVVPVAVGVQADVLHLPSFIGGVLAAWTVVLMGLFTWLAWTGRMAQRPTREANHG